MFRLLDTKSELSLKEGGAFTCTPAPLPHLYPGPPNGNYHKVIYQRDHPASKPSTVFDCVVVENPSTFFIRNLELCSDAAHMPEGLRFFFLDWFVKKMVNTVPIRGKRRLLISSSVSHITEVFVENGFDRIVRSQTMFRGSKNCFQGSNL